LLNTIFGSLSSGVAANSYESIATVTVGSGGTTTVSFTSIPQNYAHLQLRTIAKLTTATSIITTNLYFNNDTAQNYARHEIYGGGSTANAGGVIASSNTQQIVYYCGSDSQFGGAVVDILDYTNTNKNTTVRAIGGADNNGSGFATFTSGLWLSTAAITRIDIKFNSTQTASQYSSFALYGIKGA
jgi:hypothetical protein